MRTPDFRRHVRLSVARVRGIRLTNPPQTSSLRRPRIPEVSVSQAAFQPADSPLRESGALALRSRRQSPHRILQEYWVRQPLPRASRSDESGGFRLRALGGSHWVDAPEAALVWILCHERLYFDRTRTVSSWTFLYRPLLFVHHGAALQGCGHAHCLPGVWLRIRLHHWIEVRR